MSQVYKLNDRQIEKLAKVVKVSFESPRGYVYADGGIGYRYDGEKLSIEVKPVVTDPEREYRATIITDSETILIEPESTKRLVEFITTPTHKSLNKDVGDAIEAL